MHYFRPVKSSNCSFLTPFWRMPKDLPLRRPCRLELAQIIPIILLLVMHASYIRAFFALILNWWVPPYIILKRNSRQCFRCAIPKCTSFSIQESADKSAEYTTSTLFDDKILFVRFSLTAAYENLMKILNFHLFICQICLHAISI